MSSQKDQFIDALPDEDSHLRIQQSRPTTLRQALETAMEVESYTIATKKAKQVREVHLVKKDDDAERMPDEELLKQLELCVKALQHHSGKQQGRRRATARAKKDQPDAARKKGVCWLPGHIQCNCTKKTTTTAPPSGNDDADKAGHQGNGQ